MRVLIFFLVLLLSIGCRKADLSKPVDSNCTLTETINTNYSKAASLKSIVDRYTRESLPGVSLAVYTPAEGWWATGSGFAQIESQTPMHACHLQYLQSVTKMYMAVAILQLHEQGRLQLDDPITSYLPASYTQYIKKASAVTVRMLLNHTSGIPDYTAAPGYVSYLLQHPTHLFSSKALLQFISSQSPAFPPGSRYEYCNTNYLLLALLADALTGDHAAYLQQHIFTPLALTHTYYRNSKGYLENTQIVNSYWDRFGNGRIENVSQMQRANVASMMGDDGMVATPTDAIRFMKGLLEGKLLQPPLLNLMQTWVKDESGEPIYGMGMYHYKQNGVVLYGHGGAGIGAGCGLFYIPQSGTYVFIATNVGTVTDGPLAQAAERMKEDVLRVLEQ